MRLIGLTGGIATGKSTVARLLRERGAAVIDADQIARAVVEPGMPALRDVVATFGHGVLQPDGRLDRAAMRAQISRDAEARKRLEQIMHPAIAAEIARAIQQRREAGARVIVVEAALMVETGSFRNYPDLLVVTAAPEVQRKRLAARDGASAEGLIAAQLPLEEKERHATWLIRNDGTTAELEAKVAAVWAEISPEQ